MTAFEATECLDCLELIISYENETKRMKTKGKGRTLVKLGHTSTLNISMILAKDTFSNNTLDIDVWATLPSFSWKRWFSMPRLSGYTHDIDLI